MFVLILWWILPNIGKVNYESSIVSCFSAAELAAKKSRLKQKLVKSARSVAIFSLKLKERRQREAEKAATIAVEHAKVFQRGW